MFNLWIGLGMYTPTKCYCLRGKGSPSPVLCQENIHIVVPVCFVFAEILGKLRLKKMFGFAFSINKYLKVKVRWDHLSPRYASALLSNLDRRIHLRDIFDSESLHLNI